MVMPVGDGGSALASVKTDAFTVVPQHEFTAPGESYYRRSTHSSDAETFRCFHVSCYCFDELLPPPRSQNVLAISFLVIPQTPPGAPVLWKAVDSRDLSSPL